MPTGTCNYPQHHRPSAGQPVAWLVILGLGAIVVTHWHTVVVCLIVAAVLMMAGVPVLLLLHNRHSGYDEQIERQAEIERLRARQIEAPVHNHIHLHGVRASASVAALWGVPEDQMQAILARAGISADQLAARIAYNEEN
jgi:hypothetical protein